MNSHNSDLVVIKTQKVPTATGIQAWLVDYLAKELEIKPEAIDITVPFERYGLDSSAAIVLTGDLQDWLGCEFEPELLFDYQTIAELTQYIVDSGLLDSVSPTPPETKKVKVTPIFHQPDTIGVYPLSDGQQALWFLYKLAPENSAYNVAFTARICSEVDVAALRSAFQKLVDRHPLLRTTFGERDSQPVQQVHPQQEVCFKEIDAGNWDEEQLKQEVIASYKLPFDLEQGPVWRVSLFARSQKDYVLLITLHHIVCDGWSVWMLLDELRVLYPAEQEGNIANLPSLEFSYADYVNWQSEMLSGREGEKLRNYWREELAGELPILNLPTDKPRPAVQTYNGASHKFSFSQELTQQLRELAQAEGVSLFMLLLAAYQVLLYRYTNQEDILVGAPMKCRNQPEFKKVFGYLVNPVVLRGDLSGNPSFQDFLHQVRHKVLGAVAHQDYPFPLLVDELEPERDSSRSPLVQTMFVLQKPQQSGDILDLFTEGSREGKVNWGGLQLEPFDIPQQEGQFDLSVEMMEAGSTVLGVFHYNTDLFDASTIQRLEGHFQTLLQGIVAHPEEMIGKLPLLTEAELHQLLVEWNDTKADYPQDKCIHELFEEQVAKTPDAVALVFEEEQLTYQELNSRANQLAHYLQKVGVGPEILVGICVERSLEMVVGLLGILKAGGAYVPLDPTYPQERLAYMLSDSSASVLLTQEKLKTDLPEHQAKVICLDTDWSQIAGESQENLVSGLKPHNLAYVIYTSGSTGRPKGVLVEHKGLCNLAQAQIKAFDVNSNSRVLQFASFSFDASISEVVMTLCCGAILYLEKPESLLPGSTLIKLLRQYHISHITLPPSALSVMQPDEVPELENIIVAGEACSLDLVREWSRGRKFFNAYGPTEFTVCATIEKCDENCEKVTIGRPIANTKVYVLNSELQPLPIGVPGELHLGGVGLARGYLNRPELTKEKFISNPFSSRYDNYLYKTGDLARYLPDGRIEFLGRIDHQVKIRGFRIELGEIEAVLREETKIKEVVVITREDQPGNQQIAAYIVPKQKSLEISQLRQYLSKKLPEYMIPGLFIELYSLPLTPNGKVNRQALPSPDSYQRIQENIFVPPRDSVELQLTQIWSNILNRNHIGVKDEFFHLGGNSLLAIRLMAQVEKQFSKSIPVTALFQSGSIEKLANIIRYSEDNHHNISPLVAIKTSGKRTPFFCVHPAGGDVICYADLARYLDCEQPLYGLRSPALNGQEQPLITIEDMATRYIEAIRTVQPQGPYYLGGWSVGGVVAFEMAQQMAQQLDAKGEKVARLALIDSYTPQAIRIPQEIDEAILLFALARDISNIFGKELSISVNQLRQLSLNEQLEYILKQAKSANILPPEVSLEKMSQLFQVFKANTTAMHNYQPKIYNGNVALFCATEKVPEAKKDSNHSWGTLVPIGIEVHNIAGDHYTILKEPSIKLLAKYLDSYLQN